MYRAHRSIRQQNGEGTIHCAPTNWERWIPEDRYSEARLHKAGKNNISLKDTALGDGTLIISV